MDSDTIVETTQEKVKVFRFNKPPRKNAIDTDMYKRLTKALNDAATNDDISMVVLTGTGDFYSSGNDILVERPANFLEILEKFIKAFIVFPKILIAIVNGPAVGITTTILPLCDFVYASENAYFYTPFSKLGIVAEGCSTYTFPKLIGPRKTMELLLLNKKMPAQEALACGLVSKVFKPEELQDQAWKHIHEILEQPAHCVLETKKLLRRVHMDELLKTNSIEIDALRKISSKI